MTPEQPVNLEQNDTNQVDNSVDSDQLHVSDDSSQTESMEEKMQTDDSHSSTTEEASDFSGNSQEENEQAKAKNPPSVDFEQINQKVKTLSPIDWVAGVGLLIMGLLALSVVLNLLRTISNFNLFYYLRYSFLDFFEQFVFSILVMLIQLITSLPAKIAVAFEATILFMIIKNWQTKYKKELFNLLIIGGAILLIVTFFDSASLRHLEVPISIYNFPIFNFFASSFSPNSVFSLNYFLARVTAIGAPLAIYFISKNQDEAIYPEGYFNNFNLAFAVEESKQAFRVLGQLLNLSDNQLAKVKQFRVKRKVRPTKEQNPQSEVNTAQNVDPIHDEQTAPPQFVQAEPQQAPPPQFVQIQTPQSPEPQQTTGEVTYYQPHLKDNWSYLLYIVLTIVTFGFYGLYYIYKVAESVNIACDGDQSHTAGLLKYVIFSILTCGIYGIVWKYNLANRLAANGPRYGINIQENGSSYLLWFLFGSWLCGIGFFVAEYNVMKNVNLICHAYNQYTQATVSHSVES